MQAHRKLPVWYWLVWPASCFFSLPAVTVKDDSVRDIADCLDAGREDMWEKSLPNKQVTFLVYREGDQLNFFRVVDRGDGTLTPVSESLRSVQRREITGQEEQHTALCFPFLFQNYSFHVSCCFTNEDMHQHLLASLTVCNIYISSITKTEV